MKFHPLNTKNYKSQLKDLPTSPGVYLFANSQKEILYIGKAINLKARIASYFSSPAQLPKIHRLVPQISQVALVKLASELEALLLEAQLIKKHQPKYNFVAKDDKHSLYLTITKEDFPKVRLTRKTESKKLGHSFGPFPTGTTVCRLVKILRRVIPFCTCKRTTGRPCLYAHIGRCRPCPRAIVKLPPDQRKTPTRIYRKNLTLLHQLLSGKTNHVINKLEKLMNRYSKAEQFEKAAEIRDTLDRLRWLLNSRTLSNQFLDHPQTSLQQRQHAVKALAKILQSTDLAPSPASHLARIEAYDISHVFGSWTTGSLVVFIDGIPDLSHYRRFKIKKQGTINDPQALAEVLSRRLRHPDWPQPDLIVIDGGPTQLTATRQALQSRGLLIPVIGLAKKLETLYLPTEQGIVKKNLPLDSPALHLVQHLRDEAHRFARRYHQLLRRKKST